MSLPGQGWFRAIGDLVTVRGPVGILLRRGRGGELDEPAGAEVIDPEIGGAFEHEPRAIGAP
jgi:hypothetical protein